MRTTIGIDFGTLSARALLLDIENGEEIASGVCEYPHGVITGSLPDGKLLPDSFALQNPDDYLVTLEGCVNRLFEEVPNLRDSVEAIGVDFTSSTMVALTAEGVPLCRQPRFQGEPHAWCKLWKHHGAGIQAARMTELAQREQVDWLRYYGGSVSSEYMLPKLLETLEEAPDVYREAAIFAEAGDWITWQLGGTLCRSNCAAGFKSFLGERGYPSPDFLAKLNKDFADVATTKLAGPVKMVGDTAGNLTVEWARRLQIAPGIPVAVAVIDAHASVAGCGIADPGRMLMIVGTSTCHIVLDANKRPIPGANGVVKDGVVDELYVYESGQSCVGDSFSWFIDNCVPYRYVCEANVNADLI
jgi:L-ribulokinase